MLRGASVDHARQLFQLRAAQGSDIETVLRLLKDKRVWSAIVENHPVSDTRIEDDLVKVRVLLDLEHVASDPRVLITLQRRPDQGNR